MGSCCLQLKFEQRAKGRCIPGLAPRLARVCRAALQPCQHLHKSGIISGTTSTASVWVDTVERSCRSVSLSVECELWSIVRFPGIHVRYVLLDTVGCDSYFSWGWVETIKAIYCTASLLHTATNLQLMISLPFKIYERSNSKSEDEKKQTLKLKTHIVKILESIKIFFARFKLNLLMINLSFDLNFLILIF